MKSTSLISRRARRPWAAAVGFLASVALGGLLMSSAHAAQYRMPVNGEGLPVEGGVPAGATLNPTTVTPTNATLSWYGMQGFYNIEMATNLTNWTTVGSVAARAHAWSATVTNPAYPNATFRLNQANGFVGSGGCAGCHGDKYAQYVGTPHAHAIKELQDSNGVISAFFNASCVKCHSVGKNQPTGFVDLNTTPALANVGCENCHGPAGWHKYSDHDTIKPAKSIDPAICGSCHQDSHHPTFEEYFETKHAQVNNDIKYGVSVAGVYVPDTVSVGGTNLYGYFLSTNGTTLVTNRTTGIINSLNGPQAPGKGIWLYDPGQDRAASCGVCHSAATRMAMLKDYETRLAGRTNALVLPDAQDAAAWTATCVTCHDPHNYGQVAQLRYPTRSTNYYTMPTTTDKRTIYTTNWQGAITTNVVFYNSTFASLYDPNVQVCGQCHNSRGARWDGRSYGLVTNAGVISVALTTNISISRPPHHSPQYNMLIGIVQDDYLNTNALGKATNFISRHSGFSGSPYNTNQCATCHMPSYAVSSTTNVTGHTFELDRRGCALGGCHTGGVPDVEDQQFITTNNLRRLVDLLNQWATVKASNYIGVAAYNSSLQNSWEFNPVGALASIANNGPVATNQVKLPTDILQARFNAYMVLHDGSLGVHNPKYTSFLLKDAETKVLNQFTGAKFTANNQNVFTNVNVTFTNLTVGATACTWDFGDGSTLDSTATTVTHAFAAQGRYTVKLTATTPAGTDTMTRTDYILAYDKPVPSFTMSATNGTVPLTVTFTSTSQNAEYYIWAFMNPSRSPGADGPTASYTYTNAGTYQVKLTAYNEGGNVTVTNTVTVTP